MLKDTVKKYYSEKYNLNCSETMMYAANEEYNMELDKKTLKTMAAFGGGMGIESVCGVISGSLAVLGILFTKERSHESERIKLLAQEFFKKFEEKLGTITCKPLKEKYRNDEIRCSIIVDAAADVLDEMGIDNVSLVVKKESLYELPVPFLAYTGLNNGEFVIVNDVERKAKDKEFQQHWNGIVVLIEKPSDWLHEGNEKALRREKRKLLQLRLSLLAIVTFAAVALLSTFSIQIAVLLFVSLAGLGVAILIVQQELGIGSEIAEQLCGAGIRSNCNQVIHSKKSQPNRWFSWSDAGIVYFSAFLLLLVSGFSVSRLSLLTATASPFIFFSVFYQWKIEKKWCVLCLLVVMVLLAQFVLLLPDLQLVDANVLLAGPLSFAAFVFAILSTSWLLVIKPVLQNNRRLVNTNYSLLRFKRNPVVSHALIKQQRRVDISPFEHDLQLGDPFSSTQVVVACNAYCMPCAKTHKILHGILEKKDIGLTIRFLCWPDNKDNASTQAVEYLMQLMMNKRTAYKKNVLDTWFENMDMGKFRELYPFSDKKEVMSLLRQQKEWTDKAKIAFTPTIFINGYELPEQYRLDDLYAVITMEEERAKQIQTAK